MRPAEGLLVALAVPDRTVAEAAANLPSAVSSAQAAAVVHLSGALTLEPLADVGRRGWATGSLHPLQSLPETPAPRALNGITVAVDASDEDLARRLEDLVRSLGAVPRRVPAAGRTLYHAAAVLASNYVVALVAVAAGLLEESGWTRPDAMAALVPLVRGVADNLEAAGLPRALTGPIVRGDLETVRSHLEALENAEPLADLPARVYRIVGLAALELAREAGLDEDAAGRIEQALTGRPAATRR